MNLENHPKWYISSKGNPTTVIEDCRITVYQKTKWKPTPDDSTRYTFIIGGHKFKEVAIPHQEEAMFLAIQKYKELVERGTKFESSAEWMKYHSKRNR